LGEGVYGGFRRTQDPVVFSFFCWLSAGKERDERAVSCSPFFLRFFFLDHLVD
jgi:hypothetical protein